MSEWIPLLQSLVWPVFIAIFLLLSHKYVVGILKSVSARIERGDPFEAGPSGISFGQTGPKLTRLDEASEAGGAANSAMRSASLGKAEENIPARYEKVTYLVHSVSAPRMDTDNVLRREVTVIVDADSDDILNEIERVVYHLHPSFPNPDRESRDREHRFGLTAAAWGEFNLSADVYFKGYQKPLTLFRYLNF